MLVYGIGNPHFANMIGYTINEELLKKGTASLYRRFKPWDLPPYKKDKITPEEMLHGVESEEVKEGIQYFLSEYVQEALAKVVEIKKKYFSQFPGNQQFIKDCIKAGEDRGYVKTWCGSRRHFKNPKQEAYKGPNAVIQGGCGYILKLKLYELYKFLKDGNHKTRMINNVHDAVTLEMPYGELHLIPSIKAILEDLPMFRVPITADCQWGLRWGGMKDFESIEKIKEELKIA